MILFSSSQKNRLLKLIFFFLLSSSSQLVSPGTWLSDMTQERYEVREKKASKKVP